jgi:hypothetical protein
LQTCKILCWSLSIRTILESRLEREQREHDKKKREKEEMHLYLTTKVCPKSRFSNWVAA